MQVSRLISEQASYNKVLECDQNLTIAYGLYLGDSCTSAVNESSYNCITTLS